MKYKPIGKPFVHDFLFVCTHQTVPILYLIVISKLSFFPHILSCELSMSIHVHWCLIVGTPGYFLFSSRIHGYYVHTVTNVMRSKILFDL